MCAVSLEMVFFIPGTDVKIFQGARRVFTFHIEIFSLLSELANSVMKRSKCEKWKLFKPLEKFKRKGLGWVKCFLRLIEIYLYAIIISTYQEKLTESCKMGPQDPRSQKTDLLLIHFLHFYFLLISLYEYIYLEWFCKSHCFFFLNLPPPTVLCLVTAWLHASIRVTEVYNFFTKINQF